MIGSEARNESYSLPDFASLQGSCGLVPLQQLLLNSASLAIRCLHVQAPSGLSALALFFVALNLVRFSLIIARRAVGVLRHGLFWARGC